MIKVCKQCGKEFTASRNFKTICSRECCNQRHYDKIHSIEYKERKNAARRRTKEIYTIICKQCNKEFFSKSHHKKICSDECRRIRANIQNMIHFSKPENKEKKKQWFQKNKARLNIYYAQRLKKPEIAAKRKALLHSERQRKLAIIRANQYRRTEHGYLNHRMQVQKRRALKKKATIGIVNFKWIIERDGGICQICHKQINMKLKKPNLMCKSFDHIVPLTQNGEHSNQNLQLAHLLCNMQKNANIRNGVQQFLF
jgi:hypothetical protein